MKFPNEWLALFFVVLGLVPEPVAAQTVCSSSAGTECRGRFTLPNGWRIPYWRTYSIETPNAAVTRAIIVIHGVDRAANSQFDHMVAAAIAAGQLETTLIIALHFQSDTDGPQSDELFWSENNWRQGDPSLNGGGISSFSVVDQVVVTIASRSRFPNLTNIIITGHSAGGQLTNRYAAGNQIHNALTGHRIRYIIANPSSYLYFSPERPVPGSNGSLFAVPAVTCTYNRYPYGLENRNAYMSGVSLATLQAQYRARAVAYLLGSADVINEGDLDVSCSANTQGAQRFERGNSYFSYIQRFFPTTTHARVVVPNGGHSSRGMYTSIEGRTLLFTDQEEAAPGRPTDVRATVAAGLLTVSWTPPTSGAVPTAHLLDFASAGTPVLSLPVGAAPSASLVIPPGVQGTFTVTVTASAGGTPGLPSSPATFTIGGGGTCTGPPPAPAGLIGNIQSGTATVQWIATPGASAYILQAGTLPASSDLYNANVGSATVVTAGGLPPGFRAFVRVIAVNSCGSSPPSLELTVQ